jgi:peptidoglycan/LPS O-acetylase OafA/YrhL
MRASGRVDVVDGLRAIAVLAVLGDHGNFGFAASAAPAWTACGARGVDLFFAISGFCLATPVLRGAHASGRIEFSYFRFLTRRLVRIAPPYLVALTAFALLSLTAFGLPTRELGAGPLGLADGAREYVLEALFLTDLSPAFNSSFWTLGIEMRWYVLFPLIVMLYWRSQRAFFTLLAICYVLYSFTPWGISDVGTLPCFMLGIFAADLQITRRSPPRFAGPIALLAVASAILTQIASRGIDHGSPVWHFAAFALLVAASTRAFGRVLRFGPLAYAGRASYSIYLVHAPILDRLVAAGVAPVFAMVVALAGGIAFYAVVERAFLDPRFRRPAERALDMAFDLMLPRRLTRTRTTTSN